jgi:hypothetical protein
MGVPLKEIQAIFYDMETGKRYGTMQSFENLRKNLDESGERGDLLRDTMNSIFFPETREMGGVAQVLDTRKLKTMQETISMMETEVGRFNEKAIARFATFGANWKKFITQMENLSIGMAKGVQRSIAKAITGEEYKDDFDYILTNLEDVKIAMDDIFPGVGKLVDKVAELIKYLESDVGQDFIQDVGQAFENLGKLLGAIWDSKVFQTLLGWAAENPEIAITAYFFGPAALKATIAGLVTAGVTSGFAGVTAAALGPFGIALAAVILSSILKADRDMELREDKLKTAEKLLGEISSPTQGRGFVSDFATGVWDLSSDVLAAPFEALGVKDVGDSAFEKRNKQFAQRMLILFDKLKELGYTPQEHYRQFMGDIAAEKVTTRTEGYVSKTGYVGGLGGGSLRADEIAKMNKYGMGYMFEGEGVNALNKYITDYTGTSLEELKIAREEETNSVVTFGKTLNNVSVQMELITGKLSRIKIPTTIGVSTLPGGSDIDKSSATPDIYSY